MKTLKSNISEAYKVQVDCLKDSESDSMMKMIWKKVNDLARFHKAMQEKLKQHHIQNKIQILTLVPGYTVQIILMPLNTLFELHMKSKK